LRSVTEVTDGNATVQDLCAYDIWGQMKPDRCELELGHMPDTEVVERPFETTHRRCAHWSVATVLAAVSLACGGRSERVVRLPVPEAEHVAVGSESRPGLWLSPGDAVRWSLPAGPARRLTGAYMSDLAGDPAGSLRIRISGAVPHVPSNVVALSADPERWHPVSVEIPRSGEPIELELAYENPGSGKPPRSLFLAEPSFTIPARDPPRTIVLFDIDSLRADHVGSYGYHPATTPRLDHFFHDGLRAEKCIAAANWTLPAHASMFTSASVARHDAGRYSMALSGSFETLAESFAEAGYRTLAVTGGGLVHPSFGLAQGFDRYFGVSESAGDAVRRSLDLLREHRNEPVFLFFHTYQVHEYVGDEDSARDLFGGLAALGPDWRSDFREFSRLHGNSPDFPGWARNRYDAALRSVDGAFGRLVDGLQREGRLSRTAILFTADHGEALCDRLVGGACLAVGHGTPYLFDEELLVPFGIRVPWMPRAQGVIRGKPVRAGRRADASRRSGREAPAAFEGSRSSHRRRLQAARSCPRPRRSKPLPCGSTGTSSFVEPGSRRVLELRRGFRRFPGPTILRSLQGPGRTNHACLRFRLGPGAPRGSGPLSRFGLSRRAHRAFSEGARAGGPPDRRLGGRPRPGPVASKLRARRAERPHAARRANRDSLPAAAGARLAGVPAR
jgi:hypothetical protein